MSCKLTFGDLDRRLVADDVKENALRHYAEGVGLRATERLVGVSHNSVINWVKQEVAGKALAKIDTCELTHVQADELWSYIGQKNAPFGSGGLLIPLPREFSAGLWAIVTPLQPEHWVRKFLMALQSLTAPTITPPIAASFPKTDTSAAKRTRTSSRV